MRLDHLLSMETMTDHHGSVGVGNGETGKHGREELRIFCCSVFRDRPVGKPTAVL